MPDRRPQGLHEPSLRPRVLLTDYAWDDTRLEAELLAAQGIELVVASAADAQTLAAEAAGVQAIVTCWASVGDQVLAAAKDCRHVARLGIGLDNIDVASATRRDMVVTNVPDYCLEDVAEHTLALLLTLARQVAWYHQETQAGLYERHVAPPVCRLSTQTLGIVGLGAIGRAVATKAQALGLRVLAARHRHAPAVPGVTWCELDELLSESDYVSLHLPLVDETRHLIGARQLARMKPTAYLINTSRGAVIDGRALALALDRGELAGAGLDVQEPEPPPLDQPPWNDPRVIVTPHVAFRSRQSVDELRRRVVAQVLDVLAGRRPPHVVNPEVYGLG